MEFTLMLGGNLPTRKRGAVPDKHFIRRQLHPQLRALWRTHPALRSAFGPQAITYSQAGKIERPPRIEELARKYNLFGFRWVPLVKKQDFACKLDVLLLRRQEPFRAFNDLGDLDGQVKTLVDGLRMPQQSQEITGESPQEGEDPFYVLMDDDSAIFDFQIRLDRLLVPAESNEAERDIGAVIKVTVTTFAGNPISYWSGQF